MAEATSLLSSSEAVWDSEDLFVGRYKMGSFDIQKLPVQDIVDGVAAPPPLKHLLSRHDPPGAVNAPRFLNGIVCFKAYINLPLLSSY